MVMNRVTSQLFFAGSIIFLVSTAHAEKLDLDDALEPLRELAATIDVQQEVLMDRNDPAFIDVTESFEGKLELGLEKTFPSEDWDISLLSAKRSDGTFQKVMRLWTPLDDENREGTAPTICQEVSSLLVSELGEPNMTLDTSQPLPDENNLFSTSFLRMTWHHNDLGFFSDCLASHVYMRQADGGQINTTVLAAIRVTDIDNMETIQPLSLLTCRYQGTLRTENLPRGVEKDFAFDLYLNETDHQLLSLDKSIMASDVLFTDSEILGVWEGAAYARELRINRYSGASTLSMQSVTEGTDISFQSHSGECTAQSERKF